MATSSLAIVIPALNESQVIGSVVREVRAAVPADVDARVIVVDNGSADRTAEAAREAGADVVGEPRRGYGRACAAGVAAAVGCDVIVLMDGDGSDDPADLPALLAMLSEPDCRLVVGVRAHPEAGSMTPQQRLGNRVAALLIGLLGGPRVNDIGPFRAIRRADLLALEMSEMTYGWSTEMIVKAHRAGYGYREVAVRYRRRGGGVSKVGGTLLGGCRAGLAILATVARCARWAPAGARA